ncbi:MAG: methylated-DNA--[protein]-cysteine S-methyltransferase [Candidatus Omnitrophota bacterium]
MLGCWDLKTRLGTFRLFYSERGIDRVLFPGKRSALRAWGCFGQRAKPKVPAKVKRTFRKMRDYFRGRKVRFSITEIDRTGYSPFEKKVLQTALKVPYGRTVSYGELARRSGRARAARAVGGVMAKNRTPILIPCHRVVPKSGGIGHYSQGDRWKKTLLSLEKEVRG